jgi:hypothetical protein
MKSRHLVALIVFACGSLVLAGCYDSNESRPRSANQLRTRQTDNGTENVDTTEVDSRAMQGGKGAHDPNPKTGKP